MSKRKVPSSVTRRSLLKGAALKRAVAVVKRGEPALLDVLTIGR